MFDGSFYESDRGKLQKFIDSAIGAAGVAGEAGKAVSYVAPHAGYMYSGKTAAFTYRALKDNPNTKDINTIVVVGPNHTGIGRPISVSMEDWETPLGKSVNDKELSRAIADDSEYIEMDELAHENEHSIEVQLPFLQSVIPDRRMVFICMGDQSIGASEMLSKSIIKAAACLGRNIIIVASSDFNHYESAETAKSKDSRLLEAIKALDPKSFNRLVHETNDSICGFGPVTVAMMFAKHKSAVKGVVLKYCNSGDTTGDYQSVVAYSSIAFV